MPSFASYAFKAIKKHPEIFAALEEFEKTGKVPKFTYRKRIDLTINQNVLEKFKKHSADKNLNMSRLIEKLIINYLKQ